MVNGNIEALFKDRKQQEAVFPITKIKAVSDDDGVGLDALLEQMDEQINNKAPSGYGLGAELVYCNDLNTALDTGTFWGNSETAHMPTDMSFASIQVQKRSAVQSVQRIRAIADGYELIRTTLDGGVTWTEEWENPPMISGEVYRTTKRWNGKVVYATLVNCGKLAQTMTITTGLDGSSCDIVSSKITMGNMIANYFNPTTTTIEQWDFVGWTNLTQVHVRAGSTLVAGGDTVYARFEFVYR